MRNWKPPPAWGSFPRPFPMGCRCLRFYPKRIPGGLSQHLEGCLLFAGHGSRTSALWTEQRDTGRPRQVGKTPLHVGEVQPSLPRLFRTSLFRICSSDSWTSMRGSHGGEELPGASPSPFVLLLDVLLHANDWSPGSKLGWGWRTAGCRPQVQPGWSPPPAPASGAAPLATRPTPSQTLPRPPLAPSLPPTLRVGRQTTPLEHRTGH